MVGKPDRLEFMDLRNIPSVEGKPGVRTSPMIFENERENTASADLCGVLGYVSLARVDGVEGSR